MQERPPGWGSLLELTRPKCGPVPDSEVTSAPSFFPGRGPGSKCLLIQHAQQVGVSAGCPEQQGPAPEPPSPRPALCSESADSARRGRAWGLTQGPKPAPRPLPWAWMPGSLPQTEDRVFWVPWAESPCHRLPAVVPTTFLCEWVGGGSDGC